MELMEVLLHRVHLKSELVTGCSCGCSSVSSNS